VQAALKTLPWVEPDTIRVDVPAREVKFTVKDKQEFSLQAVKDALARENFNDVTLKSGPS
jgi:hypothetical protein